MTEGKHGLRVADVGRERDRAAVDGGALGADGPLAGQGDEDPVLYVASPPGGSGEVRRAISGRSSAWLISWARNPAETVPSSVARFQKSAMSYRSSMMIWLSLSSSLTVRSPTGSIPG
ncbi:MAG TPA: hypothetical protein VK939_07115 [Longimicrobiales bacterium]|nr:hypothetical protein [Longimicrobiales bacterium]